MGLFDSLKGMAMQEMEAQGPAILTQCLAKTPLGDCSGLVQQLQQSGLGAQVATWMGPGANAPVSADQIKDAMDDNHAQQMADHMGIPTNQLFQMLAQHLPGMVSQQSNG